MRQSGDPEGIDILILCTGNQARSPATEVLLRERVAGLDVAGSVRSAGFFAGGHPVGGELIELLARRKGVDLTGRRSRQVTPDAIERADLVLGMRREHVRGAVRLVPDAWPRSFTLKELVRRGEAVGPRVGSEPVKAWIARAHAGRAPSGLLGWSWWSDVKDPGRSPARCVRMVGELGDLVDRLASLLWPSRDDTRPLADASAASSAV